MKEKVLILNGSFSELPIIKLAKDMGYYVITTGNMPDLIGHKYADQYIPEDYSNKEKILDIVKKNSIDHIISCANDFGVLTAAYVAEQMGWAGHDTYENALLLHHKDKFKQYCLEKNIPSPHSIVFDNYEMAIEYINNCKYPIIVKANDLTGGKGIMRAYNQSEAEMALKNAFAKSRDKHILIEPYLVGNQQSFGAFISNKNIIATYSNDCISDINPYLIQAETLPAKGIEKIENELKDIILGIVNDLNLNDGIFCLQYIVCDGKPYVIEMMRRCFGNQFLTLATANTGFPWEEAYIRVATGQSVENVLKTEPTAKYCGHFGIMATKNGIVKNYLIPDEIQSHIFKKIDMIGIGDRINDYLNERIAYIYYSYDNQDKMIEEVKKYNNLIKIELED